MSTEYFMLISFLRKAVPGFYLLICLYIGFVGYKSMASWIYLFLFGSFGMSSYMLLNEPEVVWIPLWVTNEHWFVATMLASLLVGVALFIVAMETEDLDWPWELVKEWKTMLREMRES